MTVDIREITVVIREKTLVIREISGYSAVNTSARELLPEIKLRKWQAHLLNRCSVRVGRDKNIDLVYKMCIFVFLNYILFATMMDK